jgi:hypothetical protein
MTSLRGKDPHAAGLVAVPVLAHLQRIPGPSHAKRFFPLRKGLVSGAGGPPGRGLFRRGQAWPDEGIRGRTGHGGGVAGGHRPGHPPPAAREFRKKMPPGVSCFGHFLRL